MISFEIKWGAKRFDIELSQEEFDTMTVSDVKSKCQQLTKVEPQFMKLIVKGGIIDKQQQHQHWIMSDLIMYTAILKDDAQLIKDTKIGQGSKVMLMGGSKVCWSSNTRRWQPVLMAQSTITDTYFSGKDASQGRCTYRYSIAVDPKPTRISTEAWHQTLWKASQWALISILARAYTNEPIDQLRKLHAREADAYFTATGHHARGEWQGKNRAKGERERHWNTAGFDWKHKGQTN